MKDFHDWLVLEMTDRHALFAAVVANPYDRLAVLVMSDWLAEQGDPAGEAVRLLADPSMPRRDAYAASLRARGELTQLGFTARTGNLRATVVDEKKHVGYDWEPPQGRLTRVDLFGDLEPESIRVDDLPDAAISLLLLWWADHLGDDIDLATDRAESLYHRLRHNGQWALGGDQELASGEIVADHLGRFLDVAKRSGAKLAPTSWREALPQLVAAVRAYDIWPGHTAARARADRLLVTLERLQKEYAALEAK